MLLGCVENFDTSINLVPSVYPRFLSTTSTDLYFSTSKAQSDTFNVLSQETPWLITNTAEWLDISPVSGQTETTVTASVQENLSGDITRSVVMYLTSDIGDWSYEQPISVTQVAAEKSITLTTQSITFSGAMSTVSLDVYANCEWEAFSSNDWLSVEKIKNGILISVQANSEIDYRTSNILVRSTGDGNQISKIIKVSQAPANIETNTESINFSNVASSVTLSIHSEAPWRASTSDSWISVNPETSTDTLSTLEIEVSPNTSVNTRAGSVSLFIGVTERVLIPVSQVGYYITSDCDSLKFGSLEQTLQFNIKSNTSWYIKSIPEWITLSQTEGNGNMTLSAFVTDNPSIHSRFSIIHVCQTGLDLDVPITVIQYGKILDVAANQMNFNYKEETQILDLVSDGTWTTHPTVDWITVSPSSANGSGKISISVSENITDEERVGYVEIDMAEKREIIKIVQSGKYFNVSEDNLTIPSVGGNIHLSVSTLDEWTAYEETDVDWLSLDKNTGVGNANVIVTAIDNPSINTRSATIIFESTGHQILKFDITQSARYLKVDAREILFYGKGGTTETITINTDGNFSITAADSWFVINQSENTFTVTATENTDANARISSLTIALTDLNNEEYALTLSVLQFAKGTSFIRNDYEEDNNWNYKDFIYGNTAISLVGFKEDKDWSDGTDGSISIDFDGYLDDENNDGKIGRKLTINIVEFKEDKNWDIEFGNAIVITIDGYKDDDYYDEDAGNGLDGIGINDYNNDNNWN